MKPKTLLLLLVCAPLLMLGQTQRTVLVEQFTAAWCLPCAGQNPVFQVLLDNNKSRALSIKYQLSNGNPTGDPMGFQNPGQSNQRADYYIVLGIPSVRIDGVRPNFGLPNEVDQAILDDAVSQMTPIALRSSPSYKTTRRLRSGRLPVAFLTLQQTTVLMARPVKSPNSPKQFVQVDNPSTLPLNLSMVEMTRWTPPISFIVWQRKICEFWLALFPPSCVEKPRCSPGYTCVFRLASRKNSGVIFPQISCCQTIQYKRRGGTDDQLDGKHPNPAKRNGWTRRYTIWCAPFASSLETESIVFFFRGWYT